MTICYVSLIFLKSSISLITIEKFNLFSDIYLSILSKITFLFKTVVNGSISYLDFKLTKSVISFIYNTV